MFSIERQGSYKLTESRLQIKALYLDKTSYAMLFIDSLGEMISTARTPKPTDYTLSIGRYRVYNVQDEPDMTEGLHLELEVGDDIWQGYLLPNGLPGKNSIRGCLLPTRELITGTPNEIRLSPKPILRSHSAQTQLPPSLL
jgi:hypothetical protein